MRRQVGIWIFFLVCFMSKAFAISIWPMGTDESKDYQIKPLWQGTKELMDPLWRIANATHEMDQNTQWQHMNLFNLGELKILPYAISRHQGHLTSSTSWVTFDIEPDKLGMEVLAGALCKLESDTKGKLGRNSQLLYLVSTKSFSQEKWKPYITLSYLRSQGSRAKKSTSRCVESISLKS